MLKQRDVDKALQNQSSIAKKIYDIVPISEPWRVFKIAGELKEKTGAGVDIRTISGCLNDMVDSGLIKCIGNDHYQRVPVKENRLSLARPAVATEAPNEIQSEEQDVNAVVQTPKQEHQSANESMDTVAVLGDIASSLVSMARQLSAVSKQVEQVALQVMNDKELTDKQLQDFHNLKNLLKSFQTN